MATFALIPKQSAVPSSQADACMYLCQSCQKLISLDTTLSGAINTSNLGGISNITDTLIDISESVEEQSIPNPKIERRVICSSLSNNNANVPFPPSQFPAASQLFDILSRNSRIDHPLCEDCAKTLIEELETALRQSEDENKSYEGYLRGLRVEKQKGDNLGEQLRGCRQEERELKRQIAALEEERIQIEEDIKLQETIQQEIDEKEKIYWKDFNEFLKQHLQFQDEEQSVGNQLHYVTAQLSKLKKTNVLNSAFHIWHNGHFGTINGFRLGRLPSVSVDWNEINAGLGQAVLLLHCLGKKSRVQFTNYRPVPYGNHSYVEEIANKRELPLHSSGSIRIFADTRFDNGLVAFLNCVNQFKYALESRDQQMSLPYKIENDKIGSEESGFYSIRRQLNSDEHWTKSLKFMLTDLRWGLTMLAANPEL